ncbi:hypothetical protein H4Q32_021640 [Labeo rohita]|uniref:PH domain-containing protein n=1 Tax=Labeo rohita TaxID=84645 RepID=A0ABQ8MRC3_LABRO|nr:hypothetical protein H4Q32_021640 [Labeo rohita]
MDLKSELLKSIWYAFTSLDVEQSGKVSKSQLKATEGTFNKEIFDELCWTMTSKKNCKPSIQQGLCSQKDCFKLFCLFNLLSEDRYPLVIIQPEDAALQDGMSVWEFLEHLSAGQLLRAESKEAFSLALDDVFMEMYHNIIKKGYLLKKGHVRRNWQERWFILKPSSLTYYVNEDLKEKKGEILLEESSVVENLPDKEGRRCLFCVKTAVRTYEMSASNMKQRVDWVQAVQTALRLRAEGKNSLHQELKLSRRKQRETLQRSQSNQSSQNEPSAVEALQQSSPEQQGETENLEQHIESIIQREVEAKRKEEEKQEREKQQAIQRDLEKQLEEAKERELVNQSTNTQMLKHWKIQLNRLMKPITPGDKVEHLPVKPTCPRQGQALTSREFITKVQTGISPEKGNGYSPSPTPEEEEQSS